MLEHFLVGVRVVEKELVFLNLNGLPWLAVRAYLGLIAVIAHLLCKQMNLKLRQIKDIRSYIQYLCFLEKRGLLTFSQRFSKRMLLFCHNFLLNSLKFEEINRIMDRHNKLTIIINLNKVVINMSMSRRNPIVNQKHNKSKSPLLQKSQRSRSASQSARNNYSCRKNKFSSQLDLLEQELLRSKNKLASCLQIYSILENSQQNQRCLQHNNTLSLYCLNERRILCVSCLYGIHKHRSHKVIPLKDCMEEVKDDNLKLKKLIDEDLQKLQYYSKVAEENKLILDAELRKTLNELDKEYQSKAEELKTKYERIKDQVKENVVPIIEKCETSKRQLQNFRYQVWQTITRFGSKKMNEDNEIMKQLLYVNLVQLCQVKCRPISKTQLESLTRRSKL